MFARLTFLWRTFLTLALSALFLAPDQQARANEKVYEKSLPSTVLVFAKKDGISVGSGVLVDQPRRLVATARHVVEGASDIAVFFPVRDGDGNVLTDPDYYVRKIDSLAIKARVLKEGTGKDLAVLMLDRVPAGASALTLAKDPPRAGQNVYCIGNSGVGDGAMWRYSPGQVRNNYLKEWQAEGRDLRARVVETNLLVNPGDSGGPILNEAGELVGLVSGYQPGRQGISIGIEVRELAGLLRESADDEDDDFLFQLAKRLKSDKKYAEAREVIQEFLKKNPRHDKALAELAWLHNELKDYDDALVVAALAVVVNERNEPAWREMAFALLQKKVYSRAAEAALEALKIDDRSRQAWKYLIQALDGLGLDEKAEEAREQLRKLERESKEAG